MDEQGALDQEPLLAPKAYDGARAAESDPWGSWSAMAAVRHLQTDERSHTGSVGCICWGEASFPPGFSIDSSGTAFQAQCVNATGMGATPLMVRESERDRPLAAPATIVGGMHWTKMQKIATFRHCTMLYTPRRSHKTRTKYLIETPQRIALTVTEAP